jgi:SAM-dependent methyltransferase
MKTNLQKDAASCVICESSSSECVYTVFEHEYPDTTSDDFFFHRCLSCGLWFLNPRPSEEELGIIYPSNYYAFSLVESGDGSRQINAKKISNYFEASRIKKVVSNFLDCAPESVLDVGCGDGSDLDLFRNVFGPKLKTFGIEPSNVAAELARRRGHLVETGLFPGKFFDNQKFDIIWSKHVIEHVASPQKFLENCRELLGEDGIIILDTPNTDSPLRKLFGRHWGGWHTPRHWYLFDPTTMGLLAKKNGLSVVAIYQMPINTYWIWGIHSSLFHRHRKFADRVFNPSTATTAGGRTLVLISLFQGFELILKMLFRKTSQMRVVMRRI